MINKKVYGVKVMSENSKLEHIRTVRFRDGKVVRFRDEKRVKTWIRDKRIEEILDALDTHSNSDGRINSPYSCSWNIHYRMERLMEELNEIGTSYSYSDKRMLL